MAFAPEKSGPHRTPRWRIGDSNSRSPPRDNRRDLSQLSAAAAFRLWQRVERRLHFGAVRRSSRFLIPADPETGPELQSGSQSLGDCLLTSRHVNLLRLNFILRA